MWILFLKLQKWFKPDWKSIHPEILTIAEMFQVKTVRMVGILLLVFVQRRELQYITNIESEKTPTGFGGAWVSILGKEQQWSKYLCTPVECFWCQTNLAKSPWNPGVIFGIISPSTHMHLQSAAHVFTTLGSVCIHGYLVLNSGRVIVNALVSSHLDYSNSVLFYMV